MKTFAQLAWLAAYAVAVCFAPPIGAHPLTTDHYPPTTPMFPIKIDTVERSVALSAHAHKECAREAFHDVAQLWQQQMLPQRFTPASPRYPHQARTRKYLDRKKRLYEQGKAKYPNVTNVLTGNMGEVLSRPGLIHAYPTRATISKVGVRYIDMRPNRSRQPEKWAELCYLVEREKKQIDQTFEKTYATQAAAHTETKRHTSG